MTKKRMLLRDILKGIKFTASRGALRARVTGITDDSRTASKGCVFIAKRGWSQDGSRFIADAIARGASAVAAEEPFDAPEGIAKVLVRDARSAIPLAAANFYGHPSRRLRVVGVTGTNGKTTITYILESILKASGGRAGVIGTISYRTGKGSVPAGNTTPGPVMLQSLLAQMVSCGTRYALIEASSHALDQGRTGSVLLDAAIFTNITGDHLDYHKTMSGYLAAKRKIFGHLKARGTAILNADDPVVRRLGRSLKKRRVVTYGVKAGADVRALSVRLSMGGTTFSVRGAGRPFEVSTRLVGMHNVSNILAAIATARALGISVDAIVKGIAGMANVPGRLEPVEGAQPFSVFVDFAHTEDALNNVLGLLRGVSGGRIVTVFGCGGDRDRKKRPLMGRAACRLSDRVVITSDNPRTEDPAGIIREIEGGIKGVFSNYDVVVERRTAIAKALGMASSGDVVILAGKGHEAYQIIGDVREPFDDRLVAAEILSERYPDAAKASRYRRKGSRCG
jgi:UDP-N-acetylmuramoyl-L-alanyl-D-glutamate--2,6-diaminopimelate ligase